MVIALLLESPKKFVTVTIGVNVKMGILASTNTDAKFVKKLGHGVHICRKRKNAGNPGGASNMQQDPAVSQPNANSGHGSSNGPQVNKTK